MDLRYEIINGSYCLVDGDEDPNCITNKRDILLMMLPLFLMWKQARCTSSASAMGQPIFSIPCQ